MSYEDFNANQSDHEPDGLSEEEVKDLINSMNDALAVLWANQDQYNMAREMQLTNLRVKESELRNLNINVIIQNRIMRHLMRRAMQHLTVEEIMNFDSRLPAETRNQFDNHIPFYPPFERKNP